MDNKSGGQNLSSAERQQKTAAEIARKKVVASYGNATNDWQKYHTAWQDYYQKYYSDYYSRAAKDYIARERMKDAREKAEEEIMSSFDSSSKQTDRKAGLSLHPEKREQSKK